MNISSSNPLINSFLTHNLITAPWFGCFKAVRITRKLSIYTKDVCDLFKMRNCHLLKNSYKKMDQSLFIMHPESCYRDASDKTWLVLWNCNWYFLHRQHKSRISECIVKHFVFAFILLCFTAFDSLEFLYLPYFSIFIFIFNIYKKKSTILGRSKGKGRR